MKPKDRVKTEGSTPIRQGLTGLAALRDKLPPGPERKPEVEAKAAPASPYARAPKLVVRRERKGHGGKTVTRIEGLVGTEAELEPIMRAMKQALGCGATLRDGEILLQGDLVERAIAFLQGQGARKVIAGN